MKKTSLLSAIFKLNFLVLIIIISHSGNLFACTPAWIQFELTVCEWEEEDIFVGKIIKQEDRYIHLKIIDRPRSCEEQPIIRIWDGPTVYCNGPFDSSVSELGSVGDSIICFAQKIDTILNSWDVIGDYRRPIDISHKNFKKIQNNHVLDFPGDGFPVNTTQDTIPYQNYINQLDSDCMEVDCSTDIENCIDNPMNCNTLELSIFPNPAHERVSFSTNYIWDNFLITDITGRVVLEGKRGEDVSEINVSDLSQGVYIFSLIEVGGVVKSEKFIKQ